MENKKISVIIPVYNTAPYLAQCLESVIFQTYENLEIIIIDDGSLDNSAEICEKYAAGDKRIKIIRQKNAGLSVVRNNGLAVATGEYVHFMDSDDFLDLDYYEKMSAAALHADADMVASGIKRINSPHADIIVKANILLVSLQEKIRFLELPWYCYVWRYLFRLSFLEKNGLKFIPGMVFEDQPFIIDAMKQANRIALVPGIQYYYLNRDGSLLSSKKDEKKIADAQFARQYVKKFFIENAVKSAPKNEILERYKIPLLDITIFKKVSSEEYAKYYFLGIKFMKKTHRRTVE